MRAVVTRVKEAAVEIDGECRGEIEQGFLVLLGVAPSDSEAEVDKLATKVCNLRVFSDADGKMNLDLATVGGKLLIISQFTLFANFKSRRPGFSGAAKPDQAKALYEEFLRACEEKGFCVEHGEFGADMQVSSVNDGPVTLLLDTDSM
jgi:D-aminoacyl-tRNA deacylase